ncbi:MAG: hypothetical protein HKO64_02285 [Xanthomonadales bacterium]|nr:hypothetical protein [Gammaproteobacteria bacterium]NNL94429.1 hypothetical protein [Xanthomonadales bacterium]
MSFTAELKRRNVLRVGAAYVVTAWLVVQVVETLFPIYGLSDSAARMVVNILAIGLVPVLILSWVFEWTPEGLKRDAEVEPGEPSSLAAAKRLDRIILIVLAVALGYFAFDKFVLDPARDVEIAETAREEGRSEALVESYGDASIAVLAFENMSPDPDQEYFADGISEEILNLLAAIPELRVISRSSAFTYKGKEVPVPQIARELNVVHILEGSVRKAGKRIRVTAQLIEGRSDTHLWSQTWDRTLENVFAIQDEIAADVVEQLQVTLTGQVPTSPRTDPEVYALTLRAKREFEFMAEGHTDRVITLLERALSLDPKYVPAMEAMALAKFMMGQSSGLSGDELDAIYNDWRMRILAVDPRNGTIQAYDAWDQYMDQRDIEGAVQSFERAMRDHPNNTEILRSAAAVFRRIGRYDLALPIIQQCVRLDPLRVQCLWLLKDVHLWAGRLDLAWEYTKRVRTIWNEPVRTFDALLLIMRNQPREALEMMETWPEGHQSSSLRAMAAHAIGDQQAYEAARAVVLADETLAENDPNALDSVIAMFAHTGDLDEAFRWLDRLIDVDTEYVYMRLLSPAWAPLHDDARWDAYRDRLGLGTERVEALPFTIPAHIPPLEPRLGLD